MFSRKYFSIHQIQLKLKKKKKKKETFSLINVKENLLFSLYEFFFFRILL